VILFSRVGPDRAKALLKPLEAGHGFLRELLGRAAPTALAGPEKLSVYVLPDRGAFVEFARSVENREVEAGSQALANLAGEAPYVVGYDTEAAGAAPAGGEAAARPLAALLLEPLGTSAALAAGKPPRWLSLGLGAYLAAQVEGRGRQVQSMRQDVAFLLRQGWMTRSQELLGGEGSAEELRAAGFSLIEWLAATRRPALAPFLRAMLPEGAKLDDIIQQGFGATREAFLQAWGGWAAQRYGRPR
jgi:hypothetical protein